MSAPSLARTGVVFDPERAGRVALDVPAKARVERLGDRPHRARLVVDERCRGDEIAALEPNTHRGHRLIGFARAAHELAQDDEVLRPLVGRHWRAM